MNYTYLTLKGWIPLRLEIAGDVGLFLYNPHTFLIVNRRGVLEGERMSDDAFRLKELSIITFTDIPNNLIEQALALSQ